MFSRLQRYAEHMLMRGENLLVSCGKPPMAVYHVAVIGLCMFGNSDAFAAIIDVLFSSM